MTGKKRPPTVDAAEGSLAGLRQDSKTGGMVSTPSVVGKPLRGRNGVQASRTDDRGARGVGRAAADPRPPYLSIQEHNNPNHTPKDNARHRQNMANRAKMCYAWVMTAEGFIRDEGLDTIVMMTVGFGGVQPTVDQAEACMNSALTNYLKKEFPGGYICVRERGTKNGKQHFHILGGVRFDAGRSTFNFDALRKKRVRGTNANSKLLALQKRLRANMPKYGFGGFVQCTPIEKNGTAASVYLMGYMTKTMKCRHPDDAGRRLIRCSRGIKRRATHVFSWNTPASWMWRMKLKEFARRRGYHSLDELMTWGGSRVVHDNIDYIKAIKPAVLVYPTFRHYAHFNPVFHYANEARRQGAAFSIPPIEQWDTTAIEVVSSGGSVDDRVGPFQQWHQTPEQVAQRTAAVMLHGVTEDEVPF